MDGYPSFFCARCRRRKHALPAYFLYDIIVTKDLPDCLYIERGKEGAGLKREKAKSDIGAMYERYYGRLMLIACSYTHDKTQAEDLVHEAFLKAILSYHATGSFLSWAARVIRNDWLNKCKHEKFMDDMDIGQLSLPAQEDLLRDYIAGEEKLRLAAMISSLPERYRSVMIASVYLNEDNAHIAATHGITEENVRQIKSRAKKMLIRMREEEDEK